ncbi:MAG: hypothetical protein J0I07_35525 [Myxococcales bacterium]|nr:hypothetical protein [Myxococcales bacterium]
MSDGASRPSGATATCLLLVGDRVVLRGTAPPEAEYAMFEIGEIELRASEPGRVREHGYQTTAGLARARLANLGLTPAVALELADAMQPVLTDAYARGVAVRRVARYLGPAEMFQSDGYDGSARCYRGVFLDLAALARDIDMDHASATLHALYLATILENEPDDTTVLLSTDACTKGSMPGARTYKRPSFTDPKRLFNALGGLAHKAPTPDIQEALPRADVIAFLRSRADAAPDEDARALYKSLEGTVSIRDMPEKGPLASPDLWAIETRIESGDLDGVDAAIDEAERHHGRTPGTTYLRARISLTLRQEPPKLIAERISALALSMTSFRELALLAAESWLDAGDPRRAMPYARDLVDSPGVDEGLLLRAQRLLARAVGAAPAKKQTLVDSLQASPQRSRPPAALAADVAAVMPPVIDSSEHTGATPASLREAREPTPAPVPALDPLPRSLEPEDLAPVLPSPPPPPRQSASSPVPPPPPSRPSRGAPPPVAARSSRAAPLSVPPLEPPSRKLPSPAPLPPANEPLPFDRAPSVPPLGRSQRPGAAEVLPHAPPPPLELELPAADPAASFTLDLPGPDVLPKAPSSAPPGEGARSSRRPRLSGVMMETRPPASFDPRAEPDSPIVPRTSSAPEGRRVSIPIPEPRSGPAPARRAPIAPEASVDRSKHDRPTPLRPPSGRIPAVEVPPLDAPPKLPSEAPLPADLDFGAATPRAPSTTGSTPPARSYMHGASLPPYRHESPAPLLPKAPLLPRLGGGVDELAEHLPLPPGLGGGQRSLDVLPTSVLEARVQFTLLARELGLDYRLKRGIELRADVSGIEAMQSVLLESFPDHVVRTNDEAYELRRHGALLSEILSRRLDAEWLDISPNELGYWVMIVPPDTRVWPFWRIARLIAMGHKERDLVSYFLELSARARGR